MRYHIVVVVPTFFFFFWFPYWIGTGAFIRVTISMAYIFVYKTRWRSAFVTVTVNFRRLRSLVVTWTIITLPSTVLTLYMLTCRPIFLRKSSITAARRFLFCIWILNRVTIVLYRMKNLQFTVTKNTYKVAQIIFLSLYLITGNLKYYYTAGASFQLFNRDANIWIRPIVPSTRPFIYPVY